MASGFCYYVSCCLENILHKFYKKRYLAFIGCNRIFITSLLHQSFGTNSDEAKVLSEKDMRFPHEITCFYFDGVT